MALTVDYSVSPFLITIPKSDLTLESGTKYKLTVDEFWLLLRDFTDNENAMPHPKLYSRIPATSSTPSITEIDKTYYTLQFEDGLYSVNIVEGNTNIREVEVKNQVSVNTNNTTGFIDPTFLEYSTFDGGVWIDVLSGITGTTYPNGTPAQAVDNFSDALAIAAVRGFNTIEVVGNATANGGLDYTGLVFAGQGKNQTTLTVLTGAIVTSCAFRNAEITGDFDGDLNVTNCLLGAMTGISGTFEDCLLDEETFVLNTDAITHFINCESGVPGSSTPTIDFNGTGKSVTMRGYNGGIKLINKTSADEVSIDLASGQVKIDLTTVTNGTIIVRGDGKVVDDATGDWLPSGTYSGLTLVNETSFGQMLQEVWKRLDLDTSSPNKHWQDSSRITNSDDIDLVSTDNGDGTFTVQRQ